MPLCIRYGSRALELLQRFYQGELADLPGDSGSGGDSGDEGGGPVAANGGTAGVQDAAGNGRLGEPFRCTRLRIGLGS